MVSGATVTYTVLNKTFDSMESLCQYYELNHQSYNTRVTQELRLKVAEERNVVFETREQFRSWMQGQPDLEALRMELKCAAIIEEAEKRQHFWNMMQGFALGDYTHRQPLTTLAARINECIKT